MSSAPPRPNFFVIGAGKAGTTSLCELLAAHGDVFVSEPKEPGFFTLPEQRKRGLPWYQSLFEGAETYTAIGEGSTTYSITGVYPEVVDLLADYSPDARIIYILREPWSRLESLWMQWRSMGRGVPRSFTKAVRTDPSFIDSSLYWKQVSAYRRRFDDGRILVLFLEDLRSRPTATLRRCYEFLAVDSSFVPPDIDRPRNAWVGKREDRLPLELMRRIPGYAFVRDSLVPAGVRQRFKGKFTRQLTERPQWDPATREWVRSQIRDDVAQVLEYAGKPADFWSL